MRYEKYQNRIAKMADVLRMILQRWQLFLLLIISIIALTSAFVVFRGSVIFVDCAPTVAYGDEIDCQATALFSKTHIEYLNAAGEWTKEAPVLPGTYQLRVVGKGFFGEKVGRAISFTVQKKQLAVHTLDGTVIYGENPQLSGDLAYQDVILCNRFEMGSITVQNGAEALSVTALPDASSIIIHDANGNDVTAAYEICVKWEELRVIPREITVTVEDASKIYDGTSFSFDGYELSAGSLAENDSLFAYFSKNITDVGSIENTPVLVLVNAEGTNVTPCYSITVVEGMLTVEKRPLLLKTYDGEFDYNGLSHIVDQYEVSNDTPLADGQTLSVFWGNISDAGEYDNIPAKVLIAAGESIDVTHNYSIFFEAGTLKINPLPITVSTGSGVVSYRGNEYNFQAFGFQITRGTKVAWHKVVAKDSSVVTDAGIYENDTIIALIDETNNQDVTSNYDITYKRGTIEIQKMQLVLPTASSEWTYDGASHYNETIQYDGFIGYQTKIIVTERTEVVDVGRYPNRLSVKIVKEIPNEDNSENNSPDEEENYIDVTHNYDISFSYGTLTIQQRAITVKPIDAEKIYDALPLTSNAAQVSSKSENNLALGDKIVQVQTNATITDAGSVTNYITPSTVVIQNAKGDDVTKNYQLSLSVGVLTVHKRELHIQTGSANKAYDGTPITSNAYSVVTQGQAALLSGHVLEAETIGSLARVGKTENICNLEKTRIYDADGNDVTQNYRISYTYGMLEVHPNTAGGLNNGLFSESGKIGTFRSLLLPNVDGTTVIAPSLLSILDERSGYVYLRLKSFGGFDGTGWNEATEYSELLSGQYSANYLAAFAMKSNPHTLTVNALDPFFFMPYYASLNGISDHIRQKNDVIYNGYQTVGGGQKTLYTIPYNDYDYYSSLALPPEYMAYEEAYRAFVYSQYLIIDDETREYMQGIIEKEEFIGNDIETILRVAQYIQNSAQYNVNYNEALDTEENIATAFLEWYGEGISQHFATAATLLYRAMGIPARYTIGYATTTTKDEWVEVDQSCIHAWVEVYVDGAGWIQIEPTGSKSFGHNGSGGARQRETIVIKPAYQYKIDNGKALNAKLLLDYDPILSDLVAIGYRYHLNISGSINSVGRAASIPSDFVLYNYFGEDVTNQYNIVYEEGVLEIFEADANLVKIELGKLQKLYDVTPLFYGESSYKITTDAFLTGVHISFDISITDVGFLTLSDLNENVDKYVSIKQNPTVSSLPKIFVLFTDLQNSSYVGGAPSRGVIENPIIQINPRPITVTATSASKNYDGTPLTSSLAYVSRGSLCEGHTLTAITEGSITDPGMTVNEITRVIITNENGEDVTDQYDVTTTSGTLTVYANGGK